MNREFLKEMEIAAEIVEKIMAENGKDIEAAKGEYDTVKKQLTAANKQIEEFKGMDIEAVKKAATEWQEKAEKAEAANQQIKVDSALELALIGNKAKSAKAAKALLDMEKIKYEDGKLNGLDEQLAALKEAHGYLFDIEQTPPQQQQQTGYNYKPKGGGQGDPPPKNLAEAVAATLAANGAKK